MNDKVYVVYGRDYEQVYTPVAFFHDEEKAKAWKSQVEYAKDVVTRFPYHEAAADYDAFEERYGHPAIYEFYERRTHEFKDRSLLEHIINGLLEMIATDAFDGAVEDAIRALMRGDKWDEAY